MNRSARLAAALALLLAALPSAPRAQASPDAAAGPADGPGLFLDGRWEGSADLGSGPERLSIRLFPADAEAGAPAGGTVEMPSRGLYGYPMGELSRGSGALAFSLLGEAPLAGSFELSGSPARVEAGESFAIRGRLRILPAPAAGEEADAAPLAEGSFDLALASSASGSASGGAAGADCFVDTGSGRLAGSLVLPEAPEGQALPVLLLLAGAHADRDGNNYEVPGRSDSLADLAEALGRLGIASLRYDRRGTGLSYRLGGEGEEPRLDDHASDARAALELLARDRRFSSVGVVGCAEGALVGALAISPAAGEGVEDPLAGRLSGLAALCASGLNELELLRLSLASAPEELRPEAEAILSALRSGGTYPEPSPYFADYFRPSAQAYLASVFARDVRAEVAAAPCPVLVAAGGADLQVPAGDSELLASARSDIAYRVVEGMSHALKSVGGDEELNYASFTDPSIPLAPGLAELLAAFARGEAPPGTNPRSSAASAGPGEASAAPEGAGAP